MKAIFMGTPEFAVNSLETLSSKGVDIALVITRMDKKQGRNMKLEMPPVKKKALEMGIEVYQPSSIKSEEAISKIKDINPELIVVTAYGGILPKEILEIPKYGCINVHASLLPKYRGASPINSCILNGDSITGITTMFMDEGLDTGDIILKDELEVFLDDDSDILTQKLAKLSEKTLGNTINMLNLNLQLPRERQDEDNASYSFLLTKEMGRIDYTKSADEIVNMIRGLQPWPCAYTTYKDNNFKIYKALKLGTNSLDKVGVILKCSEGELIVTTATNDISILEIQFSGKKRMQVKEFLKGNKLEEGVVLR